MQRLEGLTFLKEKLEASISISVHKPVDLFIKLVNIDVLPFLVTNYVIDCLGSDADLELS